MGLRPFFFLETQMRHEYILPHRNNGRTLRSPEDEPEFLLAVSPEGRVKTLRYSTNGMSSKLTCKQVKQNKRLIGVQYVTLSEQARQEGWKLLEELYEAEDRMEDCEQVYKWYRAASYRKSGKIKPLDSAYLPDALETIQNGADRTLHVELAPPQRKKGRRKTKTSDSVPEIPAEL